MLILGRGAEWRCDNMLTKTNILSKGLPLYESETN